MKVANSGPAAAQTAARALPGQVARRSRLRVGQATLVSLLYLLPSLIVFTVFVFYPLFKSFYLSLYATNPFGLSTGVYVGLKQYNIILHSQTYHDSLLVTLLYTLYTVPLGVLVALTLAVLANAQVRGIAVFRTLFALPVGVSMAAAALVFALFYNPTAGVFNYWLRSLGLDGVQWLTEPRPALWSVAFVSIWAGLGFNFIILLSGIQAIPEDIYESAKIDGASGFRLFRSITLPLLSPTLFFVLVISIISAFQSFTQIDLLTKGGPANSTNVVVYSIYRDAFINSQVGYASAQAVVLFLIMLVLTAIQFLVIEPRVHYS
ncbi:MAG TPA: sugar ABC transporter permease [Thermomicrobiales bacterium]|nr:sugar ABC transporter permease [Thermomicrobiales bacterium]